MVLQNLSEIVLEADLATGDEMRQAAEVADRDKRSLIAALVEIAELDQTALVVALARHTRTEVVDPGKVQVDPEAIRKMPQALCTRLKVMPLSVSLPGDDQTLRVAMADPTDAVARAEVEHVSGYRVEPVLMTLDAVEELIHKTYKELVTEVMPRRRGFLPSKTEEMTEEGKRKVAGRKRRTTKPHERGVDRASAEILVRALIKLLHDKDVVDESELEAAVTQLLQERDTSP